MLKIKFNELSNIKHICKNINDANTCTLEWFIKDINYVIIHIIDENKTCYFNLKISDIILEYNNELKYKFSFEFNKLFEILKKIKSNFISFVFDNNILYVHNTETNKIYEIPLLDPSIDNAIKTMVVPDAIIKIKSELWFQMPFEDKIELKISQNDIQIRNYETKNIICIMKDTGILDIKINNQNDNFYYYDTKYFNVLNQIIKKNDYLNIFFSNDNQVLILNYTISNVRIYITYIPLLS